MNVLKYQSCGLTVRLQQNNSSQNPYFLAENYFVGGWPLFGVTLVGWYAGITVSGNISTVELNLGGFKGLLQPITHNSDLVREVEEQYEDSNLVGHKGYLVELLKTPQIGAAPVFLNSNARNYWIADGENITIIMPEKTSPNGQYPPHFVLRMPIEKIYESIEDILSS